MSTYIKVDKTQNGYDVQPFAQALGTFQLLASKSQSVSRAYLILPEDAEISPSGGVLNGKLVINYLNWNAGSCIVQTINFKNLPYTYSESSATEGDRIVLSYEAVLDLITDSDLRDSIISSPDQFITDYLTFIINYYGENTVQPILVHV